jgi:hypothetical protein
MSAKSGFDSLTLIFASDKLPEALKFYKLRGTFSLLTFTISFVGGDVLLATVWIAHFLQRGSQSILRLICCT